jgi:DNA repair photolyase
MRSVKKKSLLYKSKVEYANFCINHVLGCAHGCTYPCYALLMAKRFGRVKDYADWIEPKLVENALEILDEEIPRYKKQIDFVHLCFTTDPFMYGHAEVQDLTLEIIRKLNDNGIKTTVLTKGVYPEVLADRLIYGYHNTYGVSLVSLSEAFRRRFEPFSAPFADRIDSLQYLHEAGLQTWVSIEPYPTPNLFEQDIFKLLDAVEFVNRIVFGRMNYNVKAYAFANASDFYEKCAISVIDFCKEHNIQYHIKNGTRLNIYGQTKKASKNAAMGTCSPLSC